MKRFILAWIRSHPEASAEVMAAAAPAYRTSPERLERLEKLRRGVMSSWEGALMWGEGNFLSHVWAPMVVGAVDALAAAERVIEGITPKAEWTLALDNYVRDVDSAAHMRRPDEDYEEADARRQELERLRAARAAAAAKVTAAAPGLRAQGFAGLDPDPLIARAQDGDR